MANVRLCSCLLLALGGVACLEEAEADLFLPREAPVEPEVCGCIDHNDDMDGDVCGGPGQTTKGSRVLEYNCGAVSPPYCEDQFGCTVVALDCDCLATSDIGGGVYFTWSCKEKGEPTLEPCTVD